jgi:hypothetical protein
VHDIDSSFHDACPSIKTNQNHPVTPGAGLPLSQNAPVIRSKAGGVQNDLSHGSD